MKLGDFIFWASQIVYATVCLRGLQIGQWKRYPPFYLYIAFNLLSALLTYSLGVAYGFDGSIYSFAWSAIQDVEIALRVLIWLWIYRLILKATPAGGFKADMAMSILAAVPIAAYLLWGGEDAARPLSYYFPYTIIFPIQLIACTMVYIRALRSRGFQLGRNLAGILFGFSLMTAVHAINISRFAAGFWSFPLFAFVHQSTSLLTLLIFAATMWNYWPPSTGSSQPPEPQKVEQFSRNLAKAVRSLREQRQ